MSISAVVWLAIGLIYFLVPLAATLLFSLKSNQTGSCCTLANYGRIFHDGAFWHTIRVSFQLSLETIAISLVLFVPTVYWVHLKMPRLRPVIAFFAVVPFVVPPIVLIVGLLDLYNDGPRWFSATPQFLVPGYVILAFPYVFFSLDAGFRAIDVHTLTEASQSLGASWHTTLLRVILPNIKVAAVGGAMLTLAVVMGEYTMASLALFNTFPVYVEFINESEGFPAAALSLISFGITWAAMLTIFVAGRRTGGPSVAAAGAR